MDIEWYCSILLLGQFERFVVQSQCHLMITVQQLKQCMNMLIVVDMELWNCQVMVRLLKQCGGPGDLVLVVDGTGTGTGSNTSMEIWVSCLVVPIHHDNLSLKSKMHTYINQFLIS